MKSLLAASSGDMEAARTALAQAGPDIRPCDTLPRMRNRPTPGGEFPQEAMRWGFEGWALVETLVLSDGTLAQPRTIMSYPAFVFDEAAERVAMERRFYPYLPEGARCPILSTIRFRIAP